MKTICLLMLAIFTLLFNTVNAQQNAQVVEELLNAQVTTLISEGKFDEANKIIDDLLTKDKLVFQKNPILLALAYRKKGAALNYLNQKQEAIGFFRKAIDITKKENPNDYATVARLHYLSLLAFKSLNRSKETIIEAEKAIKTNKLINAQDSSNLADVYYELGDLFSLTKDYGKANDYLQRSIALKEKLHYPMPEHAYSATLYALEGLRAYDEAVAFFQKKVEPSKNIATERELARVYQVMGNIERQRKNYADAIRYNQASIKLSKTLFQRSQNPIFSDYIAKNLKNLCMVYQRTGDYQKAEKNAQDALLEYKKYYNNIHNENTADVYDHLGDVAQLQKNNEKALTYYHTAIQCLMPDFKGKATDTPTLGNRSLSFLGRHLLVFLASKGKVLYELSKKSPQQETHFLNAALENYRTLDTLVVRMRQSLSGEESKFLLTDEAVPAYGTAIQTAYRLYEKTKEKKFAALAFTFSEQAKAVILDEHFRESRAKAAHLPDALAKKERDLLMEEAEAETRAYTQPSDENNAALFDLQQKIALFRNELERQYPKYYAEKYQFEHSNLATIEKKLPSHSALIAYFYGENDLFIFLILKNEIYLEKQKINDTFQKAVEQFRRATSDWAFVRDSTAQAEQYYLQQGYALYQMLLEGCIKKIDGRVSRLIIVPDDQLSYISFDGLLTSAHKGSWVDRKIPFLLNSYAISYAYAARLLAEGKKNSQQNIFNTFKGFGIDYKNYKYNNTQNPQHQELPHAIEEVKNLHEKMGGNIWLNEQANKQSFLTEASHSTILHLAMHASIDEKDPLHSGLIFSKTNENDDPFLYASEISSLQLNTSLVVLSACNTGHGTIKRGEGVMSLSRAFALAGCPSLMMSLWSVSDASTKTIMDNFYEQLLAGTAKDQALQQAKLAFLAETNSEYAKPIYWQAFVALGDIEPLQLKKQKNYPLLLVGIFGALLAISVIIFFFWRKR